MLGGTHQRKTFVRAPPFRRPSHGEQDVQAQKAGPRPALKLAFMALDDGLLPRNLGYTLPGEDLGRWTLDGLLSGSKAKEGVAPVLHESHVE